MNDESEVLLLLHGGHGVINFGESRLARDRSRPGCDFSLKNQITKRGQNDVNPNDVNPSERGDCKIAPPLACTH